MQPEMTYFLELLGAFVRRQPAPDMPDIDSKRLIELTERSGLGGVIGYMLQAQSELPEDVKAFFDGAFYKTVFQYTRIGEQVIDLQRKLDAAGIRHAVLKGVALRHLYPVPELRTYGDMDVLLGPDQEARLRELLKQGNYKIIHEDSHQIVVRLKPLLVEFHFCLDEDCGNDTPELQRYLQDAWTYMHPDQSENCRTADPMFHFIYLLSHQLRHFHTDCPGIRTFMDIAIFLQSGMIGDLTALQAQLKELGLYDYAAVVFSLIGYWFHVPAPFPVPPLNEQDAAFATEYIVSTGLFARKQNPGARRVAEQMNHRYPRLRAFFEAAFPSAETLQKNERYARLAGKCLPLAWLYRYVYTLFHRRGYMAETTRNISVATNQAQQRVHMLSVLHLPNDGKKW